MRSTTEKQKKKQPLDHTYAELFSDESNQKQECFRSGIFIWVSIGLIAIRTIWALF